MQSGCNNAFITIFAANLTVCGVSVGSNEWTDRLGSVASSVCALHCALCAFLPVAFSALGMGFLLGEQAEWLFSILAIVFGLGALVLGWRQHRSKQVAGLLVLGIVGILASRGLEMGSDHHGHDEPHHEASEHSDSTSAADDHDDGEHHDDHTDAGGEHSDGHSDHEDATHLAGAAVGVCAGLLLLLGHIFNIRAARRCRQECLP